MDSRMALVGSSVGRYRLVGNVEIPTPKPDMVLCRVAAVALNPADAKIIDYSPAPGSIGGKDFAGEVVQVVYGFTFGLHPDDKTTGAFAEYALATEDLTFKIPPNMKFEAAATMPLSIGTAGLALYQELRLPWTVTGLEEQRFVLVWGGASSTGAVAIQLLKESRFKPVATCSLANKALLKSLGAIETFDYHSPACGLEIREYTQNSLEYVLDYITTSETMAMCYEAIGSAGGKYVSLDPFSTHVQYTRRDIYTNWIVAFTLFGGPVNFSGTYGRPAMKEHRQFATELYTIAESLVREGRLIPTQFEIKPGGLIALEAGIEDIRKGRTKKGKLVYPLSI
ncbi:GroES-like protein [Hypoxylon sp. FL1857]|nr:GroES-like protein [Hypoxylon sp. FL1857]